MAKTNDPKVSERERQWDTAIALYLNCHKWTDVAQKMGIDVMQIYRWRSENPEFLNKLELERQRLIEENNDSLRSATKEVNDALLSLVKQRKDLNVKLQAIKEFNRKFEKFDESKEIEDARQILKQIKENVETFNGIQENN